MTAIHTLHILNKTPDHPRFSECLGMLGPDDAVILTENGVLGLMASDALRVGRVYALSPDVSARGVSIADPDYALVDYPDLVELTLQAERVISW